MICPYCGNLVSYNSYFDVFHCPKCGGFFKQAIVMKRNECDNLNKPLTLDDAIAHLDDTLSDTGRKWSCESCRMEHVQLRAWLAELRDIKQKRNAPLTMDELWKIYEASEPVYLNIFRSDIDSGWEIIEQITDRKIIFRGSMGVYVPIKELGVSYNFYRQKPERGRHEQAYE